MKTAVAFVLATLTGCGGASAAISSETLAAGCNVLYDEIVEEHDDGGLEQAEAEAAVECARATCLRLHRHIEESVEDGQ